MSATGILNINDLTFTFSGTSDYFGSLTPNDGTFIFATSGLTYDTYTGFTTNPSNFGIGTNLGATSSSGAIFGVILFASTLEIVVPLGYTTGDPISSTQTFSGQTFTSLGLTPGTYTYTWGSGLNEDLMEVVIQ